MVEMKPRKPQRKKIARKKIPSQKTTEVPEPMTFRFLSLPAEIRNMIYRLLLVPSKTDVSNVHSMETSTGPVDKVLVAEFVSHRMHHGVSLLIDPTVMLLNHQVRAEYSGVYSESSTLLMNIWYRIYNIAFTRPIEMDFQRPSIRYLKSSKIVVNAGWVLSKEAWISGPSRTYPPRSEVVEEGLEQGLRCLVTVLKMMPRLESLEIIYVKWARIIRDFSNYRPEYGLVPFAELVGLRNVSIKGDVSDEYASNLRLSMLRSKTPPVRKTEESV